MSRDADPGILRVSGFYSKPELQKLNRNSIYIFVNKRLIRDRLLLHAIAEAYRNIIPPTSSPVVLLFLEMPPEEVDVNVHPAKTEVRFRQQSLVHDFVRDSLRNALIAARPVSRFHGGARFLPSSHALADSAVPISRIPGAPEDLPARQLKAERSRPPSAFQLTPRPVSPVPGKLPFGESEIAAELEQQAFRQVAAALMDAPARAAAHDSCSPDPLDATLDCAQLARTYAKPRKPQPPRLKPSRRRQTSTSSARCGPWDSSASPSSWPPATRAYGSSTSMWHMNGFFLKRFCAIARSRRCSRQRLLMPLLVELKPWQMVIFAQIADELERNGFEVEPFGPQTLAVKAAPVGLEGAALERMLTQVIEQSARLRPNPR